MALADIAASLEEQLTRDPTHLSAALVHLAPLDWFLHSMLGDSTITYAARPLVTLEDSQQRLRIRGDCSYLAYRDVDLTITLTQTSADITAQAETVLHPDAVFRLPGLSWMHVQDLRIRLDSGWSWDPAAIEADDLQPVQIVRAVFLGNIHLPAGDIQIPVRIETAAGNPNLWYLSLDTTQPSGLSKAALLHLAGGFEPSQILPDQALFFLDDIALQQFVIAWDARGKLVTGLSFTLGAKEASWDIVAGQLSVAQPELTISIDNPTQSTRVLRALVSGTIELQLAGGTKAVPVAVGVSRDELSLRVGGSDPITLPGPDDLAALMFGSPVKAALPPQFEVTGITLNGFFVSYDIVHKRIARVVLDVGAGHWPILSGLALRELELRVEATTPLTDPRVEITGTIEIGKVAIPVSVERGEGGHWAFNVAKVELPSFAEVLSTFGLEPVPGLKRLGGITLEALQLEFNPHERRLESIFVSASGLHGWQPIEQVKSLTVRDVAVRATVRPGGQPRLTGNVTGTVTVFDASETLTLDLERELTLSLDLDKLQLSRLVKTLLHDDAELPMVPDVNIEKLTLTATPSTGYLHVSSTASGSGILPIANGARLDFSRIGFDYIRDAHGHSCKVSTQGSCFFTTDLDIKEFSFDFASTDGNWSFATDVEVTLFGMKKHFTVDYGTTSAGQHLAISLLADPPWPLFDGTGMSLLVRSATLQLVKQQEIDWDFTSDATLTLPAFGEVSGHIELTKQSLRFSSPETFTLPVVHGMVLSTTFKEVKIQWSPDWELSCTNTIDLTGVPALLHDYGVLPAPLELLTKTQHGKTSIELKDNHVMKLVPFTIPDIVLGASPDQVIVPLSQFRDAQFGVKEISISISTDGELLLSIIFTLVLPSNLNDIFGTHDVDGKQQPRLELFSTQPIDIEFDLGIADKKPVMSFSLNSPPILTQYLVPHPDQKCWDIDFGQYGAVSMSVPKFEYQGASFGTDGEVTVTRQLSLPLLPLRLLLGHWLHDQDRARHIIPDAVPIAKFSLADVLDTVKRDHSDLSGVVDAIKKDLGKLPGRLLDYLEFTPPEKLGWHINMRADASVELGFKCEPPIRVLLPTPSGLIGFTFRSLSFGPLLGGSLFQLKLSCDFDQFDLPSLAFSLALGDDQQLMLRRDFHRSILVEDLFMIIVYETVIPIPIPIFYTSLGIESVGIEGFDLEAHAKFPAPTLSLPDLAHAFMQLRKFAQEPEYHLQPSDVPNSILPNFSLSKCFAQLPAFISKDAYVGNQADNFFPPPPPLSQHIIDLLNAVKFISINNVVQLLPLDYRVGKQLGSTAAAPPALNFLGVLAADCEWLLATPYEFLNGQAFQRVALDATEAKELVRTCAPTITEDTPGVILLLKAAATAGKLASVGVRLCLAYIKDAGFATGFRIYGMAGELELSLSSTLELDTSQKRMNAAGAAYLKLADWQLFDGKFTAHTSREGFSLDGHVKLLPDGFPVHAGGTVTGTVTGTNGIAIDNDVQANLSVITLAGARVHITNDQVLLAGQFLANSLTLRYQVFKGDYVFTSVNRILAIDMGVKQTCHKDASVTTQLHADIILRQLAFDATFLLPMHGKDKATLTMFGARILDGWIEQDADHFRVGGEFSVFPPHSFVNFTVGVSGTLSKDGLLLKGSDEISVLGVTLNTSVVINNGLPAITGTVTTYLATVSAQYGLGLCDDVLAFCASYKLGPLTMYLVVSPSGVYLKPWPPRNWPLPTLAQAVAAPTPPLRAETLAPPIVGLAHTRAFVKQLLTGGALRSWTDEQAAIGLWHVAYYGMEIGVRHAGSQEAPDLVTEVILHNPTPKHAQGVDLFSALRAAAHALPVSDDMRVQRIRMVMESVEQMQINKRGTEDRATLLLSGTDQLSFSIDLESWNLSEWLHAAMEATAQH